MKTTEHFETQIAERGISREWCNRVVAHPIATETQANGRIRYWGYIAEADRYLRVVLLEDGETFHTTHFDRGFRRRP